MKTTKTIASPTSRWVSGVIVIIILATGCATTRHQHASSSSPVLTGKLIVPGNANIYGAGHLVPPNPNGGGRGVLPPAFSFPVASNQVLVFNAVTGSVRLDRNDHPFEGNGADGGPLFERTDVHACNGLSGIVHSEKTLFLAGVFLDDNEPANPPPSTLDFSPTALTDSFAELAPALRQVFFIGDGLAGNGAGGSQRFVVPNGATRLFLGFADSFNGSTLTGSPGQYGDNDGVIAAQFVVVPAEGIHIMSQPSSCTNAPGSEVAFRVVATGSRGLQYQWFKGGKVLVGETTSSLTLSNVWRRHAGSYWVLVRDHTGASVKSAPAVLTIGHPNETYVALQSVQSRLDEQTKRLDRLYRVLGPFMESLERQGAEIERRKQAAKSRAFDQALGQAVNEGRYPEALTMLEHKFNQERIDRGLTNEVTLQTLWELTDAAGRLGDWNRCEKYSRLSMQLPGDDLALLRNCAAASIMRGDEKNYRELCDRMMAEYEGTKDPTCAERTAKMCLLVPDLDSHQQAAARLASFAASSITNVSWFNLVKGMAEYRTGQPDHVIQWLEPALSTKGSHFQVAIQAGYIGAMAYYRLNDAKQAQLLLHNANAQLDAVLQQGNLSAHTWKGGWIDAVCSIVLRAEAERLILGRQVAPFPTTASLAEARKTWWTLQVKLGTDLPAKWLASRAWKASWSPDSKQVVFARQGGGLAIMNLATRSVANLLPGGFDPAWSPDGRFIAFVEKGGKGYESEEVWIVPAEGGSPVMIGKGGFPGWSTDGRQVIYQNRTSNQMLAVSVDAPDRTPTVFLEKASSWYPAISLDGSRIAFGDSGKLIVIERVTGETLATLPTPGQRGLLPCWSPDGKQVAFGGFDGSRCGLWIFDVERGGAYQLARSGACSMPAWSPDGKHLVFDYRGKTHELWMIDTAALPANPVLTSQLPSRIKAIPPPRASSSSALVGKPVPGEFKLALLDGGEFVLPAPNNTNILLLDFWASWCGPCRSVMPALAEIQADYAGLGVSYVAVNLREKPEVIRNYLKSAHLPITVALDTDGEMAKAFQVRGIPTMVVIDRQGIVRKVHVGASPKTGEEIRKDLSDLLGGKLVSPDKPKYLPMPQKKRGLEL